MRWKSKHWKRENEIVSSALSKRNPNCPPRVHFERRRRNVAPQRVRENTQGAQRRVNGVQILDLMKEFPLGGRIEFARLLALQQDFHKERQEIEIFLGRRRAKTD